VSNNRVVAEFNNPKLTGVGAMEWYAAQEGRELIDLGDGTYHFVDGVYIYKPVMVKAGWQIRVAGTTP
jgi:hypothetical protein